MFIMNRIYISLLLIVLFFSLFFVVKSYYEKRKHISLPKKFYMRKGYLKQVINTLNKIVKYPSDDVYLDFSHIEEITKGSYMVLLAQAEKALTSGKLILIHNKFPKSKKVLEILSEQKNYIHKNINLTAIDAISTATVDTKVVSDILTELRRIGINEDYRIFYDFLVELIGNAAEHGIQNKNINWWLLYYRVPELKSFKFVFVDMGVGIIGSYKRSKLQRFIKLKQSSWIIQQAFNGQLGSSTGQSNRGRGLPFIKHCVEKGFISNFILITNNVSLHHENGELQVSSNPNFVGTYLSWTVSKENFISWKNSK